MWDQQTGLETATLTHSVLPHLEEKPPLLFVEQIQVIYTFNLWSQSLTLCQASTCTSQQVMTAMFSMAILAAPQLQQLHHLL